MFAPNRRLYVIMRHSQLACAPEKLVLLTSHPESHSEARSSGAPLSRHMQLRWQHAPPDCAQWLRVRGHVGYDARTHSWRVLRRIEGVFLLFPEQFMGHFGINVRLRCAPRATEQRTKERMAALALP